MNCPYCNHKETKVIDSRESKDGTSIKRRRECINCQKRYSTIEKVLKLDLEVKKANDEIEEFNLGKIRRSLLKACEKRPITLEQIEDILQNVVDDLKKVDEQIIPTSTVGKIVLFHLKKVDEIGFLKFAIIHNHYGSMNEFLGELEKLKNFDNLTYKSKNKSK